ncbi:37468_t:CDS:1, partial [Gigaspora margarita]
SLSEQIYNAFQNPDPNIHSFFEYTTQNIPEEYFKMEACYEHGIGCMQNLLEQEVYLTKKKSSKKRAAKYLVKDTIVTLNQRKK